MTLTPTLIGVEVTESNFSLVQVLLFFELTDPDPNSDAGQWQDQASS